MALFFRQVPLRVSLVAPIIVISALLLVVLLWQLAFVYQPKARQAEAYDTANQMADRLLAAAAEQAKERGFTAAILGNRGATDVSILRDKIDKARRDGDSALEGALHYAQRLADSGWGGEALGDDMASTQAQWMKIRQARQQIDAGTDAPRAAQWVTLITGLIEAGARLRSGAFMPTTALDSAAFKNTDLKHALWLAAEYAGRERAQLAMILGSGAALTAANRQDLASLRNVVDNRLTFLQEVGLPMLGDDPQVRGAWQNLQQQFVEEFGAVREAIYAAQGPQEYGIGEQQWLDASTRAIDSLLAFGRVVSESAAADAAAASSEAFRGFWLSIVMAVGVVLVTAILVALVQTVCKRLRQAVGSIQAVERGNDLTVRLDEHGRDELAQLGCAYNAMLKRFAEIIQAVNEAAEHVSGGTEQVASAAAQTEQGVCRQRDAIAQIAAAMAQIASAVQEVAGNTAQAAQAAGDTDGEARAGRDVVASTTRGIHQLVDEIGKAAEAIRTLQTDSSQIGEVLDVINGISEQTNLLALNAAIEAARAGEHGRGFAVVADEVRSLATRVGKSTEEIHRMIVRLQQRALQAMGAMEASQQQAASSTTLTGDAGTALGRIVNAAQTISQMTAQIATAAEQQSSVASDMGRNISDIELIAEESTRAAQGTVSAAVDIRQSMQHLKQLVAQFHIRAAA